MICWTNCISWGWREKQGHSKWSRRIRPGGQLGSLWSLWAPSVVPGWKSGGLAAGHKVSRVHQEQSGSPEDKVKPCLSLTTSIVDHSGELQDKLVPFTTEPNSHLTRMHRTCQGQSSRSCRSCTVMAAVPVSEQPAHEVHGTCHTPTFRLSTGCTSALLTWNISLGEPRSRKFTRKGVGKLAPA